MPEAEVNEDEAVLDESASDDTESSADPDDSHAFG